MTEVTPKQVAKELEKRARRRKVIWLGVWGALIVLAVLYLRCGQGWGTGGAGEGEGGSSATTSTSTNKNSEHKRCQVRIDATGLKVDGKGANRDTVVEACRLAGGAELFITGDARHGDVLALQAALSAAKIDTLVHDASHH